MILTDKQERFAQLVAEGMTQADAYRNAYDASEMSDNAIWKEASVVANNPRVAGRIMTLRAAAAEGSILSCEAIVAILESIILADPNDLSSYRRLCCRHCYGDGHAYQWRDEAEWIAACSLAELERKPMPLDDGGYGFDHTLGPHAKCTRCRGEGRGDAFMSDTRRLRNGAQFLYAGTEVTKSGIKINTISKTDALRMLMQYKRMLGTDVNVSGRIGVTPELTEEQKALFAKAVGDAF